MKLNNEHGVVFKRVYAATGLSVLLILTAMIFPLVAMGEEPSGAVPERQTLPPFKNSKSFYYPDAAKREGLEGKVLVAFDIAAGGRVVNPVIIFRDGVLDTPIR